MAQVVSNVSLTPQWGAKSVGRGQYASSNDMLIIWMHCVRMLVYMTSGDMTRISLGRVGLAECQEKLFSSMGGA